MKLRDVVWGGFLLIAAVACLFYGQVVDRFDTPSYWRITLFAVMAVSGFGLVFLQNPDSSIRGLVLRIWIPTLLLRALLFPAAVSDDVNRYLWEGKLVAAGISPYAETADSAEWGDLRDSYWEGMNHKDQPTAYPPLAEIVFGAISAAAYHPLAFKLLFTLADLLTLGGVLALLRIRGMSARFAGFYAFNPIILLAYAAEAHFDALMVAPLIWAFVASLHGKTHLAVALASIATGIKWITLPLLPFFAGRRWLSGGIVAFVVLSLPAIFFWQSLPSLVEGLLRFGSTRSFNGPVYEGLLWLGMPRSLVSGFILISFSGIVFWRWLYRERAAIDVHARWILGALILLSPTVHFWYIAWILPLVCLRPNMPWILLSYSSGIYFMVWLHASEGSWILSPAEKVVFWGPFFVACFYELWSTRGRAALPPHHRSKSEEVGSLAIIIPTLNVAEPLKRALESVAEQTVRPQEVILVDAGSEDHTVEVAQKSSLNIQITQSEQGRGQQIASGIEQAHAEWVLILHADAILLPDAIEQIQNAVRGQRDIIGGALGQRFENSPKELILIEILNDLRTLFSRTAFGDQVQFFHRETALNYELMPKQPLMEDVESSWRTRETGGFIFLGQSALASYRSWRPENWFKRFGLVMRLVARYRAARLKGRAAATAVSEKMYSEYYHSRK